MHILESSPLLILEQDSRFPLLATNTLLSEDDATIDPKGATTARDRSATVGAVCDFSTARIQGYEAAVAFIQRRSNATKIETSQLLTSIPVVESLSKDHFVHLAETTRGPSAVAHSPSSAVQSGGYEMQLH
ncbi:hypothetical protein ACH5RR_008991 [Cinchona calisaya]|uniref:Uncharacterized protein n=1 Tax=Cinchona calisaya TaxID=153742 RepID=A0ABD3AEP8_9GENT